MAWAHGEGSTAMHFYTEALPWVVAVLAIFVLIRWITKTRAKRKEQALRTLQERHARGEITKDQFERMKTERGN